MIKIFTLITISFLTLTAAAQNTPLVSNSKSVGNLTSKPETAVKGEALLLSETTFDFGKIPQGKPVTHIFDVTNIGKDSLHIVNVQASCGCTTPNWDRNKVQAPGAKTSITVGYNAAGEGPFTKPITITYNGTQTKQIIIKGDVWKTPVGSAPENKELGKLKD